MSKALLQSDLDSLVEACVPVQKRRHGAREEVRRREELADSILRDQQKPVLRLSELNDRLIVSGGAGTGKTLIAMEVAQRKADKGYRVALLCYNKLVGDWMQQRIAQARPIPPNLVIGRAIRVMAEMTNVAIPEASHQHSGSLSCPSSLKTDSQTLIWKPHLNSITWFWMRRRIFWPDPDYGNA